jgi:hypothetical protein
MAEGLDLIKEVIGQPLHVVALNKIKNGATLEQLVQLIRYVDESSQFECSKELEPFERFPF